MKEQFTKGPWFVVGNGYVQTSTFDTIMMPGNSSKQIEANAQLIAAAPEMFEALKRAHDSLVVPWRDNMLSDADKDLYLTIRNLLIQIGGTNEN